MLTRCASQSYAGNGYLPLCNNEAIRLTIAHYLRIWTSRRG